MEYVQIIVNIAVLSVLFIWVHKGAAGNYVTKKDVATLIDERQKLIATIFNKNLEAYLLDNKEIHSSLSAIRADYENIKEQKPPSITAIQEGAKIARENIECGSRIVLEALARDGRISPQSEVKPVEAVNLGEEDFEFPVGDDKLPDIIVARNQKVAEQIGDRLLGDLMEKMNEKI